MYNSRMCGRKLEERKSRQCTRSMESDEYIPGGREKLRMVKYGPGVVR